MRAGLMLAPMDMGIDGDLARLRLLQLVSPSLPIGGYTYSQGMEWAVEAGWIRDADDLAHWLDEQLQQSMLYVEVPVLLRMMDAVRRADLLALGRWVDRLLAWRETAELRAEESQRGRALADLLMALGVLSRPDGAKRGRVAGAGPMEAGNAAQAHASGPDWYPLLARSQIAAFAVAAVSWRIAPEDACGGLAWSWCENLVSAGVKLVPLGQTDGQQVLLRLAERIPAVVGTARGLDDDTLGVSSPALAIASSAHEVQYTRLFRS
jgi:urease accessory protein